MVTRVAVCLFVLTSLLSGWQLPAGSDCALDGSVTNAITNEPIPRARVMIGSAGPSRGTPSFVTADNSGHWRFSNVTCGPIQVVANRPGFLNAVKATPVVLISESPAHDVGLRLTPASVITGKILDDQGDPVANAQVFILSSRVMDGHRTFVLSGNMYGPNSGTNDLGEFRFAGLTAGKYIVCANGSGRGPADPVMLGETCYPGSIENGAAGSIDLSPGGQMRADMTLHEVQPVHVRGVLTGLPKGQGVALTLNRRSINTPPLSRPAKLNPDGKFDIAGVQPGSYVLTTDYFEAGTRLHARVPVEVGNSDVNDITVRLDSGFVITGKLHIESKSEPTPADQKVVVALRSVEPMTGGGPTQWSPDRSTFTIADLTPGNYRLDIQPGARFFVKSATFGGRNILGEEFPILPPGAPLDIVLSDDTGALDIQIAPGAIGPATSATVLNAARQATTVVAASDGHATVPALAPGDYRVYSWDDPRQAEYADPAWMKRYGGSGAEVSVRAGQTASVTVKQQTIPSQ